MTAIYGRGRQDTVRYLAAVAAAMAAVLYFLIGLGVLWVGDTTDGSAQDLFAFGAITGVTFAVTALLLARFQSRVLWMAVGVLQMIVIVGYVALSGIRTPPFEPWGLLVKACQVVVLAAVAYLVLRPIPTSYRFPSRGGTPSR